MKLNTTCVRQISNDEGTIYLFDIYKRDGSFCFEPCLVFEKVKYGNTWDNSDYVFNFLAGVKDKKEEQIRELKSFCRQNNLDYKQTKKELIAIFKDSKKIGLWKQQ